MLEYLNCEWSTAVFADPPFCPSPHPLSPQRQPLETKVSPSVLQEAQLADVKWQQAVFEVLLSYHPFWLRLGLETVVGQLLPAETGKPPGLDPCMM